jgi:plasmid maintenance system antidote protein VapI
MVYLQPIMELKSYANNYGRKKLAKKLGTTLNYLNNLCQHPEQAGKKMALRIEKESKGIVTKDDLWFPKQNKAGADREALKS